MKPLFFLIALALLSGCGGSAGNAPSAGGTFPAPVVVTGLNEPTAMALAPDGRIFICEQGGALRIVKDDLLLAAPFVTLTVDSTGERGLLGVALDPAFATNGFVYLHYTATTPVLHNRVSRFTAAGDLVVPGSEAVLLELDDLSAATNHNGGALHVGPEGALYLGVGENANGANAQALTNLLGKILRMNRDGTVPADNPLLAQTTGRNQLIWAYGLRNPFTFAFQPGTGRLFINDVGQSAWEEIDEGTAGANFGWPTVEGPSSVSGLAAPLYAYPHAGGPVTGCAIAGGAFYDPAVSTFPNDFLGAYLFMDLCEGWIRVLNPATGAVRDWLTDFDGPVDLVVAPDGSVWVLSRGGSGTLRRITYLPPA